jgi:HPt (histidine-containing phosphotransfer) domain-containing protein
MAKDFELEQAVAALRREFAAALPARLDALRAALEGLRQGATGEALQALHLVAHALHGTAGAYDARELVPHATRLAMLARTWVNSGVAPDGERDEAARELNALALAVEQYQRRIASA